MDFASFEDETLIRFIAKKQVEALSELYDRYGRLVYSLALYMVSNEGTAEEITQDTFMRVWDKAKTYQPNRARVKTWVVSIARYRAIDELRRREVRPEATSLALEDLPLEIAGEYRVEEDVRDRLKRQRTRAAISELPPEQKQVIALAYFQGFSQSEIAKILNIPLGTVKTRIRLAMVKIRTNLSNF
jgi:RNA polymerase sigma-70 factor (ECF subfamily)